MVGASEWSFLSWFRNKNKGGGRWSYVEFSIIRGRGEELIFFVFFFYFLVSQAARSSPDSFVGLFACSLHFPTRVFENFPSVSFVIPSPLFFPFTSNDFFPNQTQNEACVLDIFLDN